MRGFGRARAAAASMRPQHITAENPLSSALPAGHAFASMRPQHITAENLRLGAARERDRAASMRPQHITAENGSAFERPVAAGPSFNEAAAYHCGKRKAPGRNRAMRAASMRPQHITAENLPARLRSDADCAASMRPQHITAENERSTGGLSASPPTLQ